MNWSYLVLSGWCKYVHLKTHYNFKSKSSLIFTAKSVWQYWTLLTGHTAARKAFVRVGGSSPGTPCHRRTVCRSRSRWPPSSPTRAWSGPPTCHLFVPETQFTSLIYSGNFQPIIVFKTSVSYFYAVSIISGPGISSIFVSCLGWSRPTLAFWPTLHSLMWGFNSKYYKIVKINFDNVNNSYL